MLKHLTPVRQVSGHRLTVVMNMWCVKCNADKGWQQTASSFSVFSKCTLLVLKLASLQNSAAKLSNMHGSGLSCAKLHCIACALCVWCRKPPMGSFSFFSVCNQPIRGLAIPCRLCSDALPLQLSDGLCGLFGLLRCHVTDLIVSLDLSQQSRSLFLRSNQWLLPLSLQLSLSFCQTIDLLLQGT